MCIRDRLKRLPYDGPRPRLLSSLPAMPAFLEPPPEEAGLLRGVQTHRLLGLMDPVSYTHLDVYKRPVSKMLMGL